MKTQIRVKMISLVLATMRAQSPSKEIIETFRDLSNKAAAGTPRDLENALPVCDHLQQGSNDFVTRSLPTVFSGVKSPYVTVRSLAMICLLTTSVRPDGQLLLSSNTDTFASTLVDTDIPNRRLTLMIIDNLRPDRTSPLVPSMEAFLSREDAVETIGGGVAGILLRAAPDDAASIDAVVRFMKRKDQTLESRESVLQSIRLVRTQNREIGKAVASYADSPDNITSRQALETLQGMGKTVLSDNQALLQKVAADSSRDPKVRTAAKNALSPLP